MNEKQKQTQLRKQVLPYEHSETMRSVRQLFNTFIPFIFLWILAYKSLSISYALTFMIALVAAGFLTRIFIIFHDCCHNSFFKNRKANRILGTVTGIITLFPFKKWQHSHNVHHAGSGNLDKRGIGDIWMMTVDEYMNAGSWAKLQYRLYRNPLIMFGLGPIYAFLIQNRFNRKGAKAKEKLNTYLTNGAIAAIVGILCYTLGWQSFLMVQGTIFYIAGVMGIWLFYVQHTFEDSYFEESEDWEYVKAAVEGSSYYKLPKPLQWLTGNIGYHHVHHLSPRVPNYKLEDVHNHTKPLQHVPTITLATSLQSLRYRLWDEEEKKFVTFQAVHKKAVRKKKTHVA
ncbi:fatty acid desaturase [Bacillus sp. 1P06AnD]|uniref:fatty acid desaturase n=1 Tax=Bacillus sp. 1P06AnD TaxID=3132208 RepID=UPI00399F16C8